MSVYEAPGAGAAAEVAGAAYEADAAGAAEAGAACREGRGQDGGVGWSSCVNQDGDNSHIHRETPAAL